MNKNRRLIFSLLGLWVYFSFAGGKSYGEAFPSTEPSEYAEPHSLSEEPDSAEEEEDGSSSLEGDIHSHGTPALLSMGARMDVGYGAGSNSVQGFSVPSMRLWAFGDLSDDVGYRVAFGETREFSSAMLPQLMPMQAYLHAGHSAPNGSREGSSVLFKIGMFTPTQNPWWTPDLGYLNLPTYHSSQRAMLLPPDVGAEINYQPWGDSFLVAAGVFNGNGNFALNVNNSKAFTLLVQGTIHLASDGKLMIGTGAYDNTQSTPGETNYRSNWATDTYVSLEMSRWLLTLDFLTGVFDDSTRKISPMGGAGTLTFRFTPNLKFFSRLEQLQRNPTTGGRTRHAEIGPLIDFNSWIKTFLLYDYIDNGSGDIENALQVRIRLMI